MFTAAEYRLIRKHCPEKLDNLLENLKIRKPNWDAGDEFRIYEKLDEEIVQKICQLMKSDSIISGYTNFMTLGNLPFDYSETDNKLLATILENQEKILNGLTLTAETYSPPSKQDEYDFSNVNFEMAKATFDFRVPPFTLKDRKKIHYRYDELADKIKKLVCEFFLEHEKFTTVTDIEISVKTENRLPNYRKNFVSSEKQKKPSLNRDEMQKAFETFKLLDKIIKSI